MPIVSKAQQGFVYAHKDDPGSTGKAARDFIAAGPKGGSFSKLPDKVAKTENRKAGNAVKSGFQKLISHSKSLGRK